MKILCTKTVVMEDSEQAFTEGKVYNTYKYNRRYDYEVERVICAKNDFGERHIIKSEQGNDLDNFFNTHFKEVV